jgi:hypothetical protein
MHDQLKTFLAHLRSTATTVVAAVATMTLASCSSAPPQETVDEFLQSPNIRALSTQEVKTLLVDAVLETTWIPVKRWRHGAYEVVDLNRPVGAPFRAVPGTLMRCPATVSGCRARVAAPLATVGTYTSVAMSTTGFRAGAAGADILNG